VVRAGDRVLVPGWHLRKQEPILPPFDQQVIDWLKRAVAAGAQVAAICTAAFLLGAAGLLDHRHCTTHWAAIAHLQRTFPLARVQDNVLFVHEPPISTSAGVASLEHFGYSPMTVAFLCSKRSKHHEHF